VLDLAGKQIDAAAALRTGLPKATEKNNAKAMNEISDYLQRLDTPAAS